MARKSRRKADGKKEIKWRDIDMEELKRKLPELKRTLEALDKAKIVSRKCLETRITI